MNKKAAEKEGKGESKEEKEERKGGTGDWR